jgi:hypothetical protein
MAKLYIPINFNHQELQRGETKILSQRDALDKFYLIQDYKSLAVGATGKTWKECYQEAYEIARAAWAAQHDDADLPKDFNVHRITGLDKGATERIDEALSGRPAAPPRDLKGLRLWKAGLAAKKVFVDPLAVVGNALTGTALSGYGATRLGIANFKVGKKQIDDHVERMEADAGIIQETQPEKTQG